MNRMRFLLCAASVPVWLALGGCAKTDSLPSLVPVSGHVTIDGRPVTSGQVTYLPQFDNKAGLCTAMIKSDGSYEIQTSNNTQTKAGAPPGKYKVTVTPSMANPADMKMTKGGMPKTEFNAKFMDQSRTPLNIEVTASGGSAYDLKLTK